MSCYVKLHWCHTQHAVLCCQWSIKWIIMIFIIIKVMMKSITTLPTNIKKQKHVNTKTHEHAQWFSKLAPLDNQWRQWLEAARTRLQENKYGGMCVCRNADLTGYQSPYTNKHIHSSSVPLSPFLFYLFLILTLTSPSNMGYRKNSRVNNTRQLHISALMGWIYVVASSHICSVMAISLSLSLSFCPEGQTLSLCFPVIRTTLAPSGGLFFPSYLFLTLSLSLSLAYCFVFWFLF